MVEETSVEMDELAAHLDRGWDLLGRGNLYAARVSARRILEIDAESPEGFTLMGAIAAAEGEPEEALEYFRQALDADPEYIDAMLYAAEVAIHPIGDNEQALRWCDQAEPLVRDPAERADMWLLRAEIHLSHGDLAAARDALDAIPGPPYPDASYYLRIGRAYVDTERPGPAIELLRRALEHEGCRGDAHYFLAIALEQSGVCGEAREHFIRVHHLDRELPGPPCACAPGGFDELVRRVIAGLPSALANHLRDVPVEIADVPPLEMVVEGFDPRAPVFLAGIPAGGSFETRSGKMQRRRGDRDCVAEPDFEEGPLCLFVYKRNVERFAGIPDLLVDAVQGAIVAESVFFFQLDEQTLDQALSGVH